MAAVVAQRERSDIKRYASAFSNTLMKWVDLFTNTLMYLSLTF